MPELRLTPALADLARLHPWLDQVAAEAGMAPRLLARMQVALEEAVANAALHGLPSAITVRTHFGPVVAELEVEDDGAAFDPTTVQEKPRATSLDDVTPGGWGLGLVRKYTAAVAYERRDGRNRLTLRFALEPP